MLVAQKEIAGRNQLIERFSDARVRTDEIFGIVRPDSLYERPIPERHRIIFYLGHLEAFDWNLLRERVLGVKTFDPDLDSAVVTALRDMIKLICVRTGISREKAYTLCSLAADLRVTQVVNGSKGIHVMLEKACLVR